MTSARPNVITVIDALSGGAGLIALSIIEGTPDFNHQVLVDPSATAFDYGIRARLDALKITIAAELQSAKVLGNDISIAPCVLLHHWWKGCKTLRQVEALRRSFPSLHSVLISHNNDPSPPNYDFYVSVSTSNAEYQLPHLIRDSDGTEINHCIIRNAASIVPRESHEPSNDGATVRVCSLQPFKIRPDWVNFVATIGSPHTRHSLIGDGPMLDHFRREAACAGSISISVPGPIDNSRLNGSVLRTNDVFLQESVKPEAGSLAILEALASGLPVIGDRSGCLPELVLHGVNGLLVSSRDEFREAAVHLLSNKSLWRRLSAGAVDRAKQYTMRRMQDRYADLIETLVHTPGVRV